MKVTLLHGTADSDHAVQFNTPSTSYLNLYKDGNSGGDGREYPRSEKDGARSPDVMDIVVARSPEVVMWRGSVRTGSFDGAY
jgi:hypothetical protein